MRLLEPMPTVRPCPPRARAVVLQVGQAKVGWVSLELMLVSHLLSDRIRAEAQALGLSEIVVSATHVHTSVGAYEPSPLFQAAGTGSFRPEVQRAVVDAAVGALADASRRLQGATVSEGTLAVPDAVISRSGGRADDRLTRLELRTRAGGQPIAEWLLFSAHPTLAHHPDTVLDPDYPGRLSAARERLWGGLSMFLPASVGNGSARQTPNEGDPSSDPSVRVNRFAERLAEEAARVPMTPQTGPLELAVQRVEFHLPSPDLSRLLPPGLSRLGEAAFCRAVGSRAELVAFRLGAVRWLAVPGEPTADVARRLESVSGAGRTVAVTDDYLSYIETEDKVRQEAGESKNQYFDAGLAERLAQAARLAFP
jgi:neutral ceramidase